MRKTLLFLICSLFFSPVWAQNFDNPDTIVVARDGTGQFRTITDAIEVCRAFMDYHKVIYIKKGTYKEKLIIPQWVQNIELCGESRDETIITYDDHANILEDISPLTSHLSPRKIGTFRTFTVRVDANHITFKNLTIENNAAKLGQGFIVFCSVKLRRMGKDIANDFVARVKNIPEVAECYNISGEYDYLLKIHATDMKYYNEFIINVLGTIDSIGSILSSFVMKEIKNTHALSL